MSRFSYEGKLIEGGSRLPLTKKIKKFLFNLKVGLFRDDKSEAASVRLSDRVLK